MQLAHVVVHGCYAAIGGSTFMLKLAAFFDTDALAPHGVCLLWRPELLWLHVVSDALIGLAYWSIPVVLLVIARPLTEARVS